MSTPLPGWAKAATCDLGFVIWVGGELSTWCRKELKRIGAETVSVEGHRHGLAVSADLSVKADEVLRRTVCCSFEAAVQAGPGVVVAALVDDGGGWVSNPKKPGVTEWSPDGTPGIVAAVKREVFPKFERIVWYVTLSGKELVRRHCSSVASARRNARRYALHCSSLSGSAPSAGWVQAPIHGIPDRWLLRLPEAPGFTGVVVRDMRRRSADHIRWRVDHTDAERPVMSDIAESFEGAFKACSKALKEFNAALRCGEWAP